MKNMNIRPMHDKVLVAENAKDTTTESGIILGGRNIDSPKATVIAIGPDVTEVNVGDVVLLDWSKASAVKVDGVQRAIVKQEHIIAVMS
jgi:co-chaperonin GroES (HSP10)